MNSGSASRRRSEGTANSGVPQKTMRMVHPVSADAGLPVAGFSQFADAALDQVALEHAQVLDEQDAVQVVGLVAEGARQQAFAVHLVTFCR